MNSHQLVRMLRDQSMDPDQPGDEAIAAWRVEAAEHGDTQLCMEIDAHDHVELARLWDTGECDHEYVIQATAYQVWWDADRGLWATWKDVATRYTSSDELPEELIGGLLLGECCADAAWYTEEDACVARCVPYQGGRS